MQRCHVKETFISLLAWPDTLGRSNTDSLRGPLLMAAKQRCRNTDDDRILIAKPKKPSLQHYPVTQTILFKPVISNTIRAPANPFVATALCLDRVCTVHPRHACYPCPDRSNSKTPFCRLLHNLPANAKKFSERLPAARKAAFAWDNVSRVSIKRPFLDGEHR